jgi:hypothetical protein
MFGFACSPSLVALRTACSPAVVMIGVNEMLIWAPLRHEHNSATRLKAEKNRVAVSNGTRIQPTQIHVTAVENGSTEYWVREVGFILDERNAHMGSIETRI